MIIVTGGAGFIGSNIVKGLNARGYTNILVVDDLTDGHKFTNLVDAQFYDYLDKDDFLEYILTDEEFPDEIEAIFHQGACSTTTEWNGRFMMENNYDYSKELLHYALEHRIPFIYASSAAVYGNNKVFAETLQNEKPINVYGYSKFLFDQYVRRYLKENESQVVGLRYFNVYGPGEAHKGGMASVAYHLNQQLQDNGVVKLFEGCEGYGNGEQCRDFVYVDDVVSVNLWFLDHPNVSGIFNCGTGRNEPFNNVAKAVLDWHGRGELQYIPFPDKLKGHYQSYTQADLTALNKVGYDKSFKTVAEGTKAYLDVMNKNILL